MITLFNHAYATSAVAGFHEGREHTTKFTRILAIINYKLYDIRSYNYKILLQL